MTWTRRRMLGALGGSALLASGGAAVRAEDDPIATTVAEIETRLGCRLGLAIRVRDGGVLRAHRADERFALTSTFKVFAAAAVLARVDRGEERLDRRVTFGQADLVDHSPTTEKRVGEPGMTLAEIAEAAITLSDNTAGNLLLDAVGGPESLTAFLRSLGDAEIRLDRREPALNEAAPGDPRDTTTPAASAAALERLAFSDALSTASRTRLLGWMEADRVADGLLRAGLPKDWRAADKTGAGGHGARAIVAVLTPPRGAALTVAVHIADTGATLAERNAAVAAIGAAIARIRS